VKAIAVRVHENLPVHVELDDLIHAGVVGLFEAVAKYRPEKQVTFACYAKHRIKGAILDSLRGLDWASRDLRRMQKRIEAATHALTGALQRHPTESEVAEEVGMDLESFRRAAIGVSLLGPVSMTRQAGQEDLPDREPRDHSGPQPDTLFAQRELRAILARALEVLPERYQRVVVLYYTKEMTMREIGDILGVNESRVSQIHKAALAKMSTVLAAAGVGPDCLRQPVGSATRPTLVERSA
jgi:RNA polymerase sigma factor for flagellar operon FliA